VSDFIENLSGSTILKIKNKLGQFLTTSILKAEIKAVSDV